MPRPRISVLTRKGGEGRGLACAESTVAGELLPAGWLLSGALAQKPSRLGRAGPKRFRTPLAGVVPLRAGSSLAERCAVAVVVPLAVGGDARAINTKRRGEAVSCNVLSRNSWPENRRRAEGINESVHARHARTSRLRRSTVGRAPPVAKACQMVLHTTAKPNSEIHALGDRV